MWQKLGRFVSRFYLWIIVATFVITGLFAFRLKSLKISPNWWEFLPQHSPAYQSYRKVIEKFGFASIPAYILIQGEDKKELVSVAQKLVKKLRKTDSIIKGVGFGERDFFEKHALLYLNLRDLKELETFLKEGFIEKFLEDPALIGFFRTLNDYVDKKRKNRMLRDVRELRELKRYALGIQKLLNFIKEFLSGQTITEEDMEYLLTSLYLASDNAGGISSPDYLVSKDRKAILIGVTPKVDLYSSVKLEERLVKDVRRVITTFKEEVEKRNLKISLTGGAPVDVEGMEAMQEMLNVITPLAIAGVVLIVVIAFRTFLLPSLSLFMLIIGVLWVLGITQLLYGTLNIVNSIIGALLVGLGIDFAIHTYARYQEERERGKAATEAIETVYRGVGPGIFTGAVTTAVFFFAIYVMSGKAIKQLSVLTGIGILIFFVLLFIVYSSLILLIEKKRVKRKRKEVRFEMKTLGKIGQWSSNHARLILFLTLLLTIIMSIEIRKISINYNPFESFSYGLDSWEGVKEVEKHFGIVPATAILLAKDKTELKRFKTELEKHPLVKKVLSAMDLVPDNQDEKLRIIRRIRNHIKSQEISYTSVFNKREWKREIDRFADTLLTMEGWALTGSIIAADKSLRDELSNAKEVFKKSRETLTEIKRINNTKGIKDLSIMFSSYFQKEWVKFIHMLDVEKVTLDTLPSSLKEKFVGNDRELLAMIYPHKSVVYSKQKMDEFISTIRKVSPEFFTGEVILFAELMKAMMGNLYYAIAFGLVGMLIALFVKFRKAKYVAISLVPLFVGWLWTLGIMGFLGIRWDIMNIIAVVIIMGIGVDDGVHILHRFLSERGVGIERVMTHTGKAILLTTLTTMWGFGSLGLGSFYGFKSLSFIVVTGLLFFFIATILLIPAILRLLHDSHQI